MVISVAKAYQDQLDSLDEDQEGAALVAWAYQGLHTYNCFGR
jgi:hypothetical protein